MNIYRVSYRDKTDKHLDYDFFENHIAADAAGRRAEARGRKAEVLGPWEAPLTRKALMNALQQFGGRAENG